MFLTNWDVVKVGRRGGLVIVGKGRDRAEDGRIVVPGLETMDWADAGRGRDSMELTEDEEEAKVGADLEPAVDMGLTAPIGRVCLGTKTGFDVREAVDDTDELGETSPTDERKTSRVLLTPGLPEDGSGLPLPLLEVVLLLDEEPDTVLEGGPSALSLVVKTASS